MNRSEVITITAQRTEAPEPEVEKIVTAFFEVCTEVLSVGEPVNVRRFGKFEPRLRRAQRKPNPKSGELMEIPERISATFLPSDILKERLNGEVVGVA